VKNVNKKTILIFLAVYALFTISGFLFPVDQQWYDALQKPEWTPPGSFIGVVWAILYALISLAVAIIYGKRGFSAGSRWFFVILLFNYVFNQAFSFFQFELKNLWLATIDCALVALTALLLALAAKKISSVAFWLLIPYLLWSCFATYLSYTIYSLNI
jgi:tryptophan-rich sensory protein